MKESTQKLLIPISIIAAAVIIGVAIIIAFSNKTSSSDSQSVRANNAPKITRLSIEKAAEKAELDVDALTACVATKQTAARVDADIANGQAMRVAGTPFVVAIGPDGETLGIAGAQPIEQWNRVINYLQSDEEMPPIEGDQSNLVRPVTEDDHSIGKPDAAVTLVEYSDIDCPFCQRLHETFYELIASRDDVRWVYRHFPITNLHPDAYEKSLATECAYIVSGNDHDAFWEYLDLLVLGKTK